MTRPVPIAFLTMSLARLYWLSVVTFGLYHLYWFYKNWQAIKTADNSKIWPFWRTIFLIFFAWPLFKRILEEAQKRAYRNSYIPSGIAALYIVLLLIANGLSRYPHYNLRVSVGIVIVLLVVTLPLLVVQRAINYQAGLNHDDNGPKEYQRSWIETIFIGVGVLIFISAMGAYFLPQTSVTPATETKRSKVESLTEQFSACAAEVQTMPKDSVERSAKVQTCEELRVRQNTAVEEYNALIK